MCLQSSVDKKYEKKYAYETQFRVVWDVERLHTRNLESFKHTRLSFRISEDAVCTELSASNDVCYLDAVFER